MIDAWNTTRIVENVIGNNKVIGLPSIKYERINNGIKLNKQCQPIWARASIS